MKRLVAFALGTLLLAATLHVVAQEPAGGGAVPGEATLLEVAEPAEVATSQPSEADSAGDPAAPDPYAETRAQAEARLEGLMGSVGGACTADSQCPSPLRCFATVCQVPPAMTGEATEETPVVRFRTESGVALYYLEVARTGAQRQRGLMHRPYMRDDWGMLFVFASESPLSFWMQNTYMPLDMVFLDDDMVVVGVVSDAVPLTTESRAVEGSSRYVIELNAGEAARQGIAAGTQAELLQAAE